MMRIIRMILLRQHRFQYTWLRFLMATDGLTLEPSNHLMRHLMPLQDGGEMTFKYLASPYSHPDPAVRHQRYETAGRCLVWLLKQQIWTYSPIVHNHNLAVAHALPTTYEFWDNYNQALLRVADELLVLCDDGYRTSRGIAAEIAFARNERIPISGVFIAGDSFKLCVAFRDLQEDTNLQGAGNSRHR